MSREDTEALLVFLANETLDGEERNALEASVAQDPKLAAELAALRRARQTLKSAEQAQSPGASGLARLMRDIEPESTPIPVPLAANMTRAPRVWKIAAVLFFGLFVAQTTLIAMNDAQSEPDMKLASGDAGYAGNGPTLRVDFHDSANLGDLSELLLDLELIVIDGPSSIGFYTLEAPDQSSRDHAFEALQEHPDLVDTVE